MIPVSTFNLLIGIDILLIIYSVVDHRNRIYANIPVAFISALLATFLGAAISNEVVYEIMAGAVSPIRSVAIGSLLYLIATVMFGYTLFMVYEVIDEAFQKKAVIEQQEVPQ